MSIFISIASYRDPELIPTIKDILETCANPENLHICIGWQHSEEDTWDNLDLYKKDLLLNYLPFESEYSVDILKRINISLKTITEEIFNLYQSYVNNKHIYDNVLPPVYISILNRLILA